MPREPKTRPTDADVGSFIDAVESDQRRADARTLVALLHDLTGEPPVLWGPSIVGFGSYRGPTGDWPILAFSPRKANLVVYILAGFDERRDLMERLGKHTTGQVCLYLNRLSDVDQEALRELLSWSMDRTRERYPDP